MSEPQQFVLLIGNNGGLVFDQGLQLDDEHMLVALRKLQFLEGDALGFLGAQELLSLLGSAHIAGSPTIEMFRGLTLLTGGASLCTGVRVGHTLDPGLLMWAAGKWW